MSSSHQSRFGSFPLAYHAARLLVRAGEQPFADDRERYVVTEDGEVKEFGPPLKQHRLFAVASRSDVEQIAADLATFAKENPSDNWRFWTVCRPGRKSEIANLEADYREFNALLNTVLTDLRQRLGFEFFVCGIHVRFDRASGLFDIHAHLICRLPADEKHCEKIRSRLLIEFSRVDLPKDRIRNPAGAARYCYRTYNQREVLQWPQEALVAAWRLGGKRFHFTRTAGAFAKWRQTNRKKIDPDPHHLALVRNRRRNRAETRYTGSGWEYQDKRLVTRDWHFGDRIVKGTLFQRARRRANRAPTNYSTALSTASQSPPPAPLPVRIRIPPTAHPVPPPPTQPKPVRGVKGLLVAIWKTCVKIGSRLTRIFHPRE
jgi:hypothetical protein